MLMMTWTGCKDYDADYQFNDELSNRVNLALNISTIRSTTRMSDDVTQVNYADHEARKILIDDLKLFSFQTQGVIGDNEDAQSDLEYKMSPAKSSNNYRHYYDYITVKIPMGTASFLCYTKAQPMADLSESVTKEPKFVNGSVILSKKEDETPWLKDLTPNTNNITFTPEVIHNSVEVDEGDPLSHIAAYLTEIAKAIPADKHAFFLKFINEGRLVACSSTPNTNNNNVNNVQALAAWAASEGGVDLNLERIKNTTYEEGYPANINLPDGAAVVKWNKTERKFEPQPVTTTEANINRLDRFIYPAELWYYANSRIKTDPLAQKEDYTYYADWNDVLANYRIDNGVMDPSVRSVAIKDPLRYAVGCLQIGLVASNSETLMDADEQSIPFGDTTFPLTAVFVSGQYQQKFNFTPNTSVDSYEKIIYDPEIPKIPGLTMGGSKSPTPQTANATKFVSTLVFQTPDDVDVRFALEFENNSGKDFQGADGRILNGTKFYLVGLIDVTGEQAEDYKNRAFTKNYITQGTVRISSLKQAYPYLPDLLDPRLEIAVKLVPEWIQSTTTNVPL